MSKRANGRAAGTGAKGNETPNKSPYVRACTKSTAEKPTMENIARLDTGAQDRVNRWRILAAQRLERMERERPGDFDELRVMAALNRMEIVDWLIAYLKHSRIEAPAKGQGSLVAHNRLVDMDYDSMSRQARTAHEKETVAYAFFHLGAGRVHNGDLSADEMRTLAESFSARGDWNLANARERAVKFAIGCARKPTVDLSAFMAEGVRYWRNAARKGGAK